MSNGTGEVIKENNIQKEEKYQQSNFDIKYIVNG
jgi:hypothetical protein